MYFCSCCSVTLSCLTLCYPMDCNMPGILVHLLVEFAQTHVHWVDMSPSPPAFNLSKQQGLFQWVNSSHQVAKLLELQLQHQSFQWILRVGSLRIHWFDLFAVPRALKSLLQHHSSKAPILLQHSAFLIV